MKKVYNFRHSLQTLNRVLGAKGYKFNFIMQSGKPCYILNEVFGSGFRVCGYYYSASDAAKITNKLLETK